MAQRRHLIHLVPSNRWGSLQRYACDICRHFLNNGWHVTAVTRDARVVDERFRREGITLRHAPLRGLIDPTSVLRLARLFREIPDREGVIHVHRYRDAFTALVAKRIAKRPDLTIICTQHTVEPAHDSRLLRLIYNKIDAHIFVSHAAHREFFSTWEGTGRCPIPERRVHFIPNSINRDFPSPPPAPEKGPVIAICHGPVVSGKGIETVIDALSFLKGIKMRLRIAGPGNPDYLDTLRRRAMKLGVMDLIDWKIAPDMDSRLIYESHFAIHPSITKEVFGMPNLHTMACGRPQICTTSGAQPEYLEDDKTAIFVPAADPEKMADAMRKLIGNPDLRAEIGKNAYETYTARLSWPVFIRELEKLYV